MNKPFIKCFSTFMSEVKTVLNNSVLHKPLTSLTASVAQYKAEELISTIRAEGQILMPYEGMEIIGASVALDVINTSLSLGWHSRWFPAPRYVLHEQVLSPLGFFDKFDLSVCIERHKDYVGQCIVARYGDHIDDCHTAIVDGFDLSLEHNIALSQGFVRAQLVGYNNPLFPIETRK